MRTGSRIGRRVRWSIGVAAIAFGSGLVAISEDEKPDPAPVTRIPDPKPSRSESTSVAALLGNDGRRKHAARLAANPVDGKTYPWETYSNWGRELFLTGEVAKPPIGTAPSEPLSAFYRCIDCHNNKREDPVLTRQDPEARAWMITRQPPAENSEQGRLFLAPGTTLWGAVNRESFYNDSYVIYHDLSVEDGRPMDPTSLEDATQLCCNYCSIGRFATPWEINSLLTYFWDLELQISDLDLPKPVEGAVMKTLSASESKPIDDVTRTREFLRRQFLVRAAETVIAPPEIDGKQVGPYPDKLSFEGDPQLGAKLYKLACMHCHGEDKPNENEGSGLVRSLKRFHHVLSVGTEQSDEPYMPRFTAERLSRQQLIDIQSYLLSLE